MKIRITMNFRQNIAATIVSLLCTVAILVLVMAARLSPTMAGSAQSSDVSRQSATYDELQRSLLFYRYDLAARSGPVRGETLYYFKCWMCHNEYTKGGPYLKDLFKHDTLPSGAPVTEESVAAKIREGGGNMPSFQTTLSEADVHDLVSYLRDGKCCLEGEDPPKNPLYLASTNKWPVQSGLRGGAIGLVKVNAGDSPEGIRVQLIAPNSVRTTVYTDTVGKYEFPKMQAGDYVQRIATPLEFKPYRRPVHVDGANKLEDIQLERISTTETLPPTPEVEGQLSGSEILWNLSGTAEEKEAIGYSCGPGCHSYQQIFRNRYDERSWRIIVNRMTHYGPAPLILPSRAGEVSTDGPATPRKDREDLIVKWLARVRGPESKDGAVRTFTRPWGESTRVVLTEFEVPRVLLSLHDVAGDAQGNIWFTSHKSRVFGKLDSHTGIVTEYMAPLTPGALPGSHRVSVDRDGTVWISEPWSHRLMHFYPRTGEMKELEIEGDRPINDIVMHNFALAPDGAIWNTLAGEVQKIDPETGKVVKRYPIKDSRTYDNMISADGTWWAGGSPGQGNTAHFLNTRTGEVVNLSTGVRQSSLSRGGFDSSDNAWFGDRSGTIARIDTKRKSLTEFFPPTPPFPYTDFYEAMPDKNGEVWGGLLHGPGFVRYTPKTDHWITYNMAEPSAFDRRTWIDNSTTPVTVWYVDYQGYIVRIQPLD